MNRQILYLCNVLFLFLVWFVPDMESMSLQNNLLLIISATCQTWVCESFFSDIK